MAKILIVDDSAFASKNLKLIFESGDHEVVGLASNGDEALAMYESLEPDMVTLDYLMPGKSGEEILRELLDHDSAVKTIMISGSGDPDIGKQTLQIGAKAFVEKIDVSRDILEIIDQVMDSASQSEFSQKQVEYFNKFLTTNSLLAMNGLENIFGLIIDSSDAKIEIVSAVTKEQLESLGSDTLYSISSNLVGKLTGSVLLVIRSEDFACLCEMMKPVLNLMFPEDTGDDTEDLASHKASKTGSVEHPGEVAFHEHMMETLAEMGNILIGLYTKALFKVFQIKVHHSVTQVLKDTEQQSIAQLLSSSADADQQHVIIENDFIAMDKPMKLWCLTSLAQDSFQHILQQIEVCEEQGEESDT